MTILLGNFARVSVNTLFDISKRERHTLHLLDFLRQKENLEIGEEFFYEVKILLS